MQKKYTPEWRSSVQVWATKAVKNAEGMQISWAADRLQIDSILSSDNHSYQFSYV